MCAIIQSGIICPAISANNSDTERKPTCGHDVLIKVANRLKIFAGNVGVLIRNSYRHSAGRVVENVGNDSIAIIFELLRSCCGEWRYRHYHSVDWSSSTCLIFGGVPVLHAVDNFGG